MVKITGIDIFKMDMEYTYVVSIALGTVPKADNILLRINTDAGVVGWGEGSPYPPITGETQSTCIEAAKYIAHSLIGTDPTTIEGHTQLMKRMLPSHPSVRSAFDMAFWDILGKLANLPVYKLLGGVNRPLRTDITIGHEKSVSNVEQMAKKYLQQGFNEIKMKTGRSGTIDYEHVKAVRTITGDQIHLKIDSNQGWDLATAIHNATVMSPLNLLYFEQPLPAWNLDDMVRLRQKISIPICADESVFNEIDAFKICKLGAADYLNIKLGKSGGIYTGLQIDAIAESYGAKCMIGCFGESRLALTAAAHLVLARPNIVFLDLDSAYMLKEDPIRGGMTYDPQVGGLIHVPETPGLGVDVKSEFLSKWEQITVGGKRNE